MCFLVLFVGSARGNKR